MDEVLEQLKTIKNLCEIGVILINLNKEELLPTLLEELYYEAQGIMEFCIE